MYYYGQNKFRLIDNGVNPNQDPYFQNVWLGGVQFKNDVYGNEHFANIYPINKHTIEIAIFSKSGQPEDLVKEAMFEVRFYENAPTSGNVYEVGLE
jgi:hypothetical protein